MALVESGEATTINLNNNTNQPSSTGQGSAQTDVTSIDFDVTQDGAFGMIVHMHAIVNDYKGQDVLAAVYFYNDSGGLVAATDGTDSAYVDGNGWLRSTMPLTPGFDATEYDDLSLFVPYSGFPDGDPGSTVAYQAETDVYDGSDWIAPSDHYSFDLTYNGSSSTQNSQSTQTGNFTEITNIEHNISQNGVNGMIVHVHAIVRGYKNHDVLGAVYFYDTDGHLVAAGSSAVADNIDANGWLRGTVSLTPGFDATEWDDLTMFVPYNAFPDGLSGDVTFYAESDVYDGSDWIAPSEHVPLIVTYSSDNSTNNSSSNNTTTNTTGGGITASCSDFTITNGVEIVVRQMRPNFTYTATAIGVGDFDPVLIVADTANPANNLCNDDSDAAAKYSVTLPSSGQVSSSSRSSQMQFHHTNANMTDISLIVGDYNGNGGEFILILEGMAVTSADGQGDPFTVVLNPSVVNSGVPLSVYMVGLESQLDPLMTLLDGNGNQWNDDSGTAIACDDAGGPCWGTSQDLSSAVLRRGSSGTANGDSSDAMLSLAIGSVVPQPMTFLMSSYEHSSTGLYAIVFDMGLS